MQAREMIVVAEVPLLAGRDEIEMMVALTVLFSGLLHRITAAPLWAVYTCRVEGTAADAPEKQGAVELPTRVGSVPTSVQRRVRPNEVSIWTGTGT